MDEPAETRLHRIEQKLDHLLSLLKHTDDEPDATAQKEHARPPDPAITANPKSPLSLSSLSARAQTQQALPLTRDVDPRKIGYTEDMFNAQFPGLRYAQVLESFWTFYIADGRTSKNWFEKFLSYAKGAQDRANVGGIETDSTGMPVDPKLRRSFNGG